jgi:hypothetical protein
MVGHGVVRDGGWICGCDEGVAVAGARRSWWWSWWWFACVVAVASAAAWWLRLGAWFGFALPACGVLLASWRDEGGRGLVKGLALVGVASVVVVGIWMGKLG